LIKLAVSDKVVRQKGNFSKKLFQKAHRIKIFKLAFCAQKTLLKSSFTKHSDSLFHLVKKLFLIKKALFGKKVLQKAVRQTPS